MPPGSGEEVRIDLFEQEERAAKRPTRRRSRASTVAPIQAFVFAPPTAARLAFVVLPTAAAELAAGCPAIEFTGCLPGPRNILRTDWSLG